MKPDRLLLAVLVLSLLVAAFTLYQRFEVERPITGWNCGRL